MLEDHEIQIKIFSRKRLKFEISEVQSPKEIIAVRLRRTHGAYS
jgi:hypothetical protein